jgi:heme-degrading monooxygenase HmoA
MLVVCNRIPVNPEYREAFEQRFGERGRQVDGMPGFIAFQLLRPQAEGQPYQVVTFWQDEASFKAWTESQAFRQEHGRSGTLPREAFAGPSAVEIFEVIQSTGEIVRTAE